MAGITDPNIRVTGLLLEWGRGDQGALERPIPLVRHELHRIARRCMAGEGVGNNLQATALVNEAYLRLVDGEAVAWHDRAHFLALSASGVIASHHGRDGHVSNHLLSPRDSAGCENPSSEAESFSSTPTSCCMARSSGQAFAKKREMCVRRQCQCGVKELLNPLPAFRRHACGRLAVTTNRTHRITNLSDRGY